MEKNIIIENSKIILKQILLEDISKIPRQDYNRILFKLEEFENSLNETIKEYKKLEESIPNGLNLVTRKKMTLMSSYLYNTKTEIHNMVKNVKNFKKRTNNQNTIQKQ